MAKKPNASNITHGLAQLGGGSKKSGGGGMMKGMEEIFKTGVALGSQSELTDKQASEKIETSGDKKKSKKKSKKKKS